MSKKLETIIHRANGGNHSPVNYRKHINMLLDHPYSIGLLYHIVLTGSEDPKVYRKAVELLCKQLRANGMPCRYKACYERDKFKRFHKHVFLLIEAKHSHPDTIIHFRKGHWFTKMMESLGLGFKIAQPLDPMHQVGGKKVNYAYVPKKASPKLDDCLLWISYLTKVRSKEGVECQIYTGSTNREAKKPDSPSAALLAAKEENIPLEGGKVISAKAVKNSAVPATFYPIQDITPSPLSVPRQEGPIELTEKETQHESSSPTSNGPGQDYSSTESTTSGPGAAYSSSGSPTLERSRPRLLRGLQALSSGPTAEAIRPGPENGSQAESGGTQAAPNSLNGLIGPAPNRDDWFPTFGESNFPIENPAQETAMTTAERYIASKYENAVDLGLDLEAIRRYLLDRGIKRTPAAVVFDLDERYRFHGYAASHPAPPVMTLTAIDKSISREHALSRRLASEAA